MPTLVRVTVCCTACHDADVALTIVREMDGTFVEIQSADCDCRDKVSNYREYIDDLYAAVLE